MKINKTLKFIFVGFVSLSIFLAIFYIAGKKDSDNEAVSTSVSIKKPIIPSNVAKDNGQQAVANVRKQTPKIPQHEPVAKKINEKPVQITPQENFLENKDTVAGVGLTVDELKALHERQMIEFSHNSEMSEFSIDGLTFEKLQALHEKQSKEMITNPTIY